MHCVGAVGIAPLVFSVIPGQNSRLVSLQRRDPRRRDPVATVWTLGRRLARSWSSQDVKRATVGVIRHEYAHCTQPTCPLEPGVHVGQDVTGRLDLSATMAQIPAFIMYTKRSRPSCLFGGGNGPRMLTGLERPPRVAQRQPVQPHPTLPALGAICSPSRLLSRHAHVPLAFPLSHMPKLQDSHVSRIGTCRDMLDYVTGSPLLISPHTTKNSTLALA